MKKLFMSIIGTSLFFVVAVCGQPIWFKKIKEVRPGISTKSEIEKLFQVSSSDLNQYNNFEQGTYLSKWGKIFVDFNRGGCEANPNGEDFPDDTLILLEFEPYKPIKYSNLNLNLIDFHVYEEDDTPNKIYTNNDVGLRYTIADGKLKSVEITLTKAMSEAHACK